MTISEKLRFIIKRGIIILIGLIGLIILLAIKPAVNNKVTTIYFIISVVGVIILGTIFQLIYRDNIFEENQEVSIAKFLFESSDFFALFIVVCCLFQTLFVFGYFKADVVGSSMYPTLNPEDVLIVRSDNEVTNFDIVVLEYDLNYNVGSYTEGKLLVKRLIAKGGDSFYFLNNVLYLNGERIDEDYVNISFNFHYDSIMNCVGHGISYDEETKVYTVDDECYFVMGDNRGNSSDSRVFGTFQKSQIIGKVVYRINSLFDWERIA